jgi:CubicO group peptidase (beta-lactamase class C family)
MMKYLFAFTFSLFTALLSIAQSAPDTAPLFIKDSLDSYIQKGMKSWDLPGLSVVIVKNGRVVFMKGYGVRNIKTGKPVDENTLFMIASNTKLFTATSLALLEFQGKISLDDPITKYLPDYSLFDSTSTKLVSIRDLLSHRIGTKTFEGDFTFWNTALSQQEIIRRMRYLAPPHPFRQEYGYCNSCFLTAGQVVPLVTGIPWDAFLRKTFIVPLEMNHTLIMFPKIAEQENVATPYSTNYTDTIAQVPYDDWNNMAPAASIVSNVSDLSHWLIMQLDSGRYMGKQIVPWPVLQKTRFANTWVNSRRSEKHPTHFSGYGLGLFMEDYAGRQIFWHTGGAGGMVSNVCFVPEEELGIAILTNNDNQELYEDLRYQILDAYLEVPFTNHSEQDLPEYLESKQTGTKERAAWKLRVTAQNKPERILSDFTGSYTNTLYGKIRIERESNHLVVHFETKPDLTATLEYMDNGEWFLKYNNIIYGSFSVRFDLGPTGVKSLTTKQNPYVEYDPYVFIKE